MFKVTNKIKIKSVELIGSNFFKVKMIPLIKGYSDFFANMIRKLLFNSVYGYGVTEIKINDSLHEYESILGVKEDVLNLILNIKNVVFKLKKKKKLILELNSNKKIIIAKDFTYNKYVEIVNPNYVIANLSSDVNLNIKVKIEEGRGYIPVDINKLKKKKFNGILLDTYFCPIESVSYIIEKILSDFKFDFEQITFFIKTNGSITADKAIKQSIGMLLYYLSNFKVVKKDKVIFKKSEDFSDIDKKLFKPITDIDFTIRALRCLKKQNINYLGDLVSYSEQDLLKIPNLGKKTLKELKKTVNRYGMKFETKIENWNDILNKYILYKKKKSET